jgi:HamA
VKCGCKGVTLRLHFPSLRQSKPTVFELIEVILPYLVPFALPRSEVNAVDALYGKTGSEHFKLRYFQLVESAKSLFKRANEATNRNGEAGELLLYLLTEWVLGAPQLIAKMSLKTNRDMPVHGADGVHVRYSKNDNRLLLCWGESKL